MKLNQFKPWQVLALISGAIITCVMALASISYNATLGTDLLGRWDAVPNQAVQQVALKNHRVTARNHSSPASGMIGAKTLELKMRARTSSIMISC